MDIRVGEIGMVSLDRIIVTEDRARKVMGDLDGLEVDMQRSGLITPLAVMKNEDGTFRLLAGERRYIVLKRNNVAEVPVRIYTDNMTELEMRIIEKSENFFRKDMEYWEMDKLTREIHELQQQLHGAKVPGPGGAGWGIRETAAMIGIESQATVVESVKRDRARQAFPDLFLGCKTASDASKVIKKMDEAVVKRTIAEQIERAAEGNEESTIAELSKRFVIQDFFEGVKKVPDNYIHLVEIDPPYAIDLTEQKKKDGESKYILEDYNEIPKENYREFIRNVFSECYRVMAQHSWLVCWFAPEPHFEMVFRELVNAGFGTTRMVGIWTKGGSGQNMNPTTRLANTYEMFFYAWKGQPALNKAGRGNDFAFLPISPQSKTHPTERPIELMTEIYDTFSFKGSRLMIPFLGSGNGILAAHKLGISPFGFEKSKAYKDSFLVKAHLMLGGR